MNLQKTYLSRAMTRAMALDHPIGDPFGGAAYGERRDPVSAIVAVASMAASAGGAAALIGGTFTLGTVAAGLAFAGGAMSLIGNATGNKDLMKIGTVASIAGGIGGFFDAAGFAGNVAKDGAGWVSGESLPTGDVGAGQAAAGSAPSVSEQIINAPAPAVQPPPSPTIPDAAVAPTPTPTPAPSGLAEDLLGGAATNGSAPGLINSAASNLTQAPAMSYDSFGTPVPAGSAGAVTADPTGLAQMQSAANAADTAAKGSSWMDTVKSFMPDTSKMSTMDKFLAAKIGSEVVGGVVNYVSPSPQAKAQTQAAQAAAAANQAQADKIKADEELRQKRLAALKQNMSMGISVGTVNPNAVTINTPTLRTAGGIINNARTA